jgi:hypothetical protein
MDVPRMDDELTDAELSALTFFEAIGFGVERLRRARDLIPDFEVRSGDERYLVEVKSRRDDEAITNLSSGRSYARVQPGYWSMSVVASAKKAAMQLAAHDPGHRAIWVMWISVDATVGREAAIEQVRGTLLGILPVLDLDAVEVGDRDCYYAKRGVFESMPQLDAAVVAQPKGIELWVNEFGRPDVVLSCRLATLFAENGGLNTAMAHVRAGRAIAIEGGRGAKTDGEIIAYLREHCGIAKPSIMHPSTHVGLLRLNASALGPGATSSPCEGAIEE